MTYLTFEEILERMLGLVPEELDTREGSIMYNAIAPCALEISELYFRLAANIDECFVDTASRPYLIRRCAEQGIIPKAATKAIVDAYFMNTQPTWTVVIPIGARFSCGNLYYVVKNSFEQTNPILIDEDKHWFKLECETAGVIANNNTGQLIPVEYIEGLTKGAISSVSKIAEDEEITESLRQRYIDYITSKPFGGNIADYKQFTKAIAGVGAVKVYPVTTTQADVILYIADSNYGVPTSTLINLVHDTIDPTVNTGDGVGIAPIGHHVTVNGVFATTIDVGLTLTFESGFTWESVQTKINEVIESYLFSLRQNWENESALIVRISQIENRILDIPGIIDIAGTTINTDASNLTLDPNSIPVKGTVTNV